MSRKGNPNDNAFAESFIKTLMVEEICLNEYGTFEDAYENIWHFIEIVYTRKDCIRHWTIDLRTSSNWRLL
jgi:transposase InsO family protein